MILCRAIIDQSDGAAFIFFVNNSAYCSSPSKSAPRHIAAHRTLRRIVGPIAMQSPSPIMLTTLAITRSITSYPSLPARLFAALSNRLRRLLNKGFICFFHPAAVLKRAEQILAPTFRAAISASHCT